MTCFFFVCFILYLHHIPHPLAPDHFSTDLFFFRFISSQANFPFRCPAKWQREPDSRIFVFFFFVNACSCMMYYNGMRKCTRTCISNVDVYIYPVVFFSFLYFVLSIYLCSFSAVMRARHSRVCNYSLIFRFIYVYILI